MDKGLRASPILEEEKDLMALERGFWVRELRM